ESRSRASGPARPREDQAAARPGSRAFPQNRSRSTARALRGQRGSGTPPPRSASGRYCRCKRRARKYDLAPRLAWPSSSLQRDLPRRVALLHEPAVAHHQRLPGERVRGKCREEQRNLGDVIDGRELAVDSLLEHHLLDNVFLGDAERLRLLGNLL